MAEKAVHLTTTLQTKPSVFEVIAQESLAATVHPALKRIARFLATFNPEKYGWIYVRFEEVYFGCNALLQYYYLKNNGASFSEAFYGLHRTLSDGDNVSKLNVRLPFRQECFSLLCLIVLPYIKIKIDSHIEKLKTEQADNPNRANKNMTTLLQGYRFLNVTWSGLKIIQLIAYMSGDSVYHSPLLGLGKLTLGYTIPAIEEDWKFSDLFNGKASITTALGSVIIRSVEISAFFMQFLQWWHADKYQLDITALPIPPPPYLDSKAEKYKGVCPICLQTWRVATALQVSGYVFCYRCIIMHLQTSLTCPVTQYPATADDLIRIYEA